MDEEKFIERVEIMLFHTCGCTKEEAIIILEKCLERTKNRRNLPSYRNIKNP